MMWLQFNKSIASIKCVVIFTAHFVCAQTAAAQEVTFRSSDNAVAVSGRFVAFDGVVATVISGGGPVSFRTDGMVCDGLDCPDLEAYTPTLRLVGAAPMADVLMPPMIEVYARDRGLTLRENVSGFEMLDDAGAAVFTISLNIQPHDAAFDAFVNHTADALLSLRDLRADEIEMALDAGLGRLNTARQGRIIALDALVPITSAGTGRTEISLADLTRAMSASTEVFEWHGSADLAAQIDGFEERFMRPFDLSLRPPDHSHASIDETILAIEQSENGLALVPSAKTGNTQRLALSGPCGLRANAEFLTLKTEDYPLTFPMFMYLPRRNQHPQIVDFLDWLRSPSAQLVIRRAGFVDLAAISIPLADQGDRLAAAVLNAGVEVPLIELQRMMRVLSPRVRMSSTFRFEPGSTRLDGQSRSNVMQLAQAIRDGRFSGRELMFVGFSDGRGPAVANRDLSAARAEAVMRDVERALGGDIPANVSIETEAFGEALPMACDDTIWGQQTNRRVELWVRSAG